MSSRDTYSMRFINPFRIFSHLWRHRNLIRPLARREIIGRYKGSFLGLGWSFIQPLVNLCVYTFVFSVIFKSRWGVSGSESHVDFALTLFIGMITFNIFGETANAAPRLMINHTNYVKKVVFPLEILPVVALLGVLANALFSLVVLLAGIVVIQHMLHWTVVLLPLVWLPMIMFALGCAYFLASLGVFIRDIGATVGIVVTMLFFLTPIFYPISAVPEQFQFLCALNPFALFVEDARRVCLWGQYPDWPKFGAGLVFSCVMLMLGFIWFIRSKKAFADVI